MLEVLDARSSTRVFAPTPITDAEKDAILSATFRAPTGGNMMLYTMIDVADQALKDRLAVTCDDQPFMAKAPWVLAAQNAVMLCFGRPAATRRRVPRQTAHMVHSNHYQRLTEADLAEVSAVQAPVSVVREGGGRTTARGGGEAIAGVVG
jgi:nitroreductase